MTLYLIDMSTWSEYLPDTGSPPCEFVGQLIRREEGIIFLTEPVIIGSISLKASGEIDTLAGACPALR